MTAPNPKTVWWVEPNYMPGAHKVHASVWHASGRTIEASHLVLQSQLDYAIVPRLLVDQIILSMQSTLNGVIRGSAKP